MRRPSAYLVQVLWETLEERAEFAEAGHFERCWEPADLFLAHAVQSELFVECPSLQSQGPGVIIDRSWLS